MALMRFLLVGIFFLQTFLLNSEPLFAANLLDLPSPGQMIGVSAPFHPLMMKGLQYDPQHPFRFGFIVRPGDKKISDTELQNEAMGLVRYFLAMLTIPQKDLWVNLSPYEKERVIPQDLADTRLGSDLLAEDYILKQMAASLIFPDGHLGQIFWRKIYAAAIQRFGRSDVPISTFNKVWIVPGDAQVFVHGNTVIVTQCHLKVMMEADYLATRKTRNSLIFSHRDNLPTQDLSNAVMKQVVLPVLEKEINEGSYFAPLRQILNAAILAEWYKRHLKQSLVSRYYADQHKIAGINEPSLKDQIYERYVKAYKKGVYNFIREDDGSALQSGTPRKYFSGGLKVAIKSLNEVTDSAQLSNNDRANLTNGDDQIIEIGLNPAGDQAMSSEEFEQFIGDPQNQNPSWKDAQNRLRAHEGFLDNVDHHLIDDLIQGRVRITAGWHRVDIGQGEQKWVWEGRLAKNNEMGTPKGGIRYITVNDLMKTSFKKVWDRFLLLNPTIEQARLLVNQWLIQELEFLSTWGMTGKAAGLNLTLGGGKALLLKGGILKGSDQKLYFESWDTDGLSKQERLAMDLRLAEHHARQMTEAKAVGMGIDSPAPDMNTGPEILEKYEETYLRVLTEHGADSFIWKGQRYDDLYRRLKDILDHIHEYTIFENPLLEEAVRYSHEHHGLPMPWIGVFTGKRYERPVDPNDPLKGTVKMGGVIGRNEATGEGVVIVMKRFFENNNIPYKGKTVAIQGFGNVGRYTALAAAREGFIVKVINDFGITLVSDDEEGWSEAQLNRILEAMTKYNLSLRDLWINNIIPGLFEAFSRGESFIPRYTENNEQMRKAFDATVGANVDILVPAFKEEQITEQNYGIIKAHWIFEAANGPTSLEADRLLTTEGKIVVPDTLTNAGGVLVSSLEMEQALRGYEFTREEVLARMNTTLNAAVDNTIAQGHHALTLRAAFDRVGLGHLADVRAGKTPIYSDSAMTAKNGGIDLNTEGMRIDQAGDQEAIEASPLMNIGSQDQIKGYKPIFISMHHVNIPELLGMTSAFTSV